MTTEQANAIWDALVEHAGAAEWQREEFVQLHVAGRCDEFRFMGSLGAGGKFWRHTWTVDCYPEDLTPARQQSIAATNAALAELRTAHQVKETSR